MSTWIDVSKSHIKTLQNAMARWAGWYAQSHSVYDYRVQIDWLILTLLSCFGLVLVCYLLPAPKQLPRCTILHNASQDLAPERTMKIMKGWGKQLIVEVLPWNVKIARSTLAPKTACWTLFFKNNHQQASSTRLPTNHQLARCLTLWEPHDLRRFHSTECH